MHRGPKLDVPRIPEVSPILFNLRYIAGASIFGKPERFASGFTRCEWVQHMYDFLNNEKHWRDRTEETRIKAGPTRNDSQKQMLLPVAAEYERLVEKSANWQTVTKPRGEQRSDVADARMQAFPVQHADLMPSIRARLVTSCCLYRCSKSLRLAAVSLF
jgi:hypothetical protein